MHRLCRRKRPRCGRGHAAARRKMREKAVDAIVLAPVEANLGGDDCDLILLARGLRKDLGPMSKRRAAGLLIEHVAALLRRADKPARKAGLRRV